MLDDQTTLQFDLEQDGLIDTPGFYFFGTVRAALFLDIFGYDFRIKHHVYCNWNNGGVRSNPLHLIGANIVLHCAFTYVTYVFFIAIRTRFFKIFDIVRVHFVVLIIRSIK
ncbi:hypothetical protein D1872_202310 [compost metagenome]